MAMIPNLSDIPDKAPVEAGEYDLRITKVKETKSARTGRYGCQLIINIDGQDNASTIFHTLWYGHFKSLWCRGVDTFRCFMIQNINSIFTIGED